MSTNIQIIMKIPTILHGFSKCGEFSSLGRYSPQLKNLPPGVPVYSTWSFSVQYLELKCTIPGVPVYSTWSSSVQYLEIQWTVPGLLMYSTLISSVLYLECSVPSFSTYFQYLESRASFLILYHKFAGPILVNIQCVRFKFMVPGVLDYSSWSFCVKCL